MFPEIRFGLLAIPLEVHGRMVIVAATGQFDIRVRLGDQSEAHLLRIRSPTGSLRRSDIDTEDMDSL